MYDAGHGNCSTKSRYSYATSHDNGTARSNKNGLCRLPSAVITPYALVTSMHRSMSSMDNMLPLANIGIEMCSLKKKRKMEQF